jgi:surface antigen
MKKSIAAALSGALLLSGCANMPPPNLNKPATMGEVVGAVAGGVGAGLAMYYMGPGGGWGRVVLAALGATAGAAVGYQAGSMLSQMDMRKVEGAANQAFSQAPNGQAVGWDNPETGNSGLFMPTSTYIMTDGTLCRDFKTSVATQQATGQTQGTACRMSDGSWAAAGLTG